MKKTLTLTLQENHEDNGNGEQKQLKEHNNIKHGELA